MDTTSAVTKMRMRFLLMGLDKMSEFEFLLTVFIKPRGFRHYQNKGEQQSFPFSFLMVYGWAQDSLIVDCDSLKKTQSA
jgi:hypothetical protein